ncbi:hypothetical protein VTH06DRAFT_8141 [Thermothelomyces fergusii]
MAEDFPELSLILCRPRPDAILLARTERWHSPRPIPQRPAVGPLEE